MNVIQLDNITSVQRYVRVEKIITLTVVCSVHVQKMIPIVTGNGNNDIISSRRQFRPQVPLK